MKQSKRKFVVLSSLVGLLTLTSALLLALAPPPLSADAYPGLDATVRQDALDAIFNTQIATQTQHWKYIYVHQSDTATGSAATLATGDGDIPDHFIIGNGMGAGDGEIQVGPRWNRQLPAAAPAGASHLDSNCISICLIGDYNKSMPTPTQLRRVADLVVALQTRLRIPADHVVTINDAPAASGVGQYFPTTGFREQILP